MLHFVYMVRHVIVGNDSVMATSITVFLFREAMTVDEQAANWHCGKRGTFSTLGKVDKNVVPFAALTTFTSLWPSVPVSPVRHASLQMACID